MSPQVISLNFESLFYQAFLFLQRLGLVDVSGDGVVFTPERYIYFIKLFLIFVSAFCTFLIIDFLHRLWQINKSRAEEERLKFTQFLPATDKGNQRWETIENLLASSNESDWKLAIIEADKMLDELLNLLNYQGESLGEKLLAVEKGDMLSLNEAWEAHKYRNRIAHENNFQVTAREARRIMSLYAKVFKEYKYI